MSRSSELTILDSQGREKARYRLQYGAKLLIGEGKNVKAGSIIVEWDPYTIPIISEKKGTANYVDLIDGVSMREVVAADVIVIPLSCSCSIQSIVAFPS